MFGEIIWLLFLLIFAYEAAAAPYGPTNITIGSNDRRTLGIDNLTGGTIVQAQAGNVTALNINSTRVTSRWQGYYGNISGTIVLDDGNNNTLYNWLLADPSGQIYASNGSIVTWSNVFCFNYTNNLSAGSNVVQRFNGTDLESSIGARMGDHDNANSTFNGTYTGSFQSGSITINAQSGCRQTNLYVNKVAQSTKFFEVLLTDNDSIIYTSILEHNAIGFQGAAVDFEMIVGENGDTPAATNYYFFVELA